MSQDLYTDMHFETQTVETRFTLASLVFETSDEIRMNYINKFERLNRPFDIRRDQTVIVPPGEYSTGEWSLDLESAPYRKLLGSVRLNTGGFWTGSHRQVVLDLEARPWPGIGAAVTWNQDRVRLPQGNFLAEVSRLRGNIAPTPETDFTSIVQYDNLSKQLGLYARFRWILQPGSDLYLVYTHNWRYIDSDLRTQERKGTVKLAYTARF